MTVKEAIETLSKMPDHALAIMLDCSHCGHAQELTYMDEIVVLGAKKGTTDDHQL